MREEIVLRQKEIIFVIGTFGEERKKPMKRVSILELDAKKVLCGRNLATEPNR